MLCRKKTFYLLLILMSAGCTSEEFEYITDDSGITVRGAMEDQFIPRDSILTETLQEVDLGSEFRFHPKTRLWGVGQPAIKTDPINIDQYLEGWFVLENGAIALVFLSEQSEAVYFETTMMAPKQVLLIDKLQSSDRPKALRSFAVLLGTDNANLLKDILLDHWQK